MKRIVIVLTVFSIFFCADVFAKPLIIAHRGGKANWPENTIYAFQKAKEAGVDMIEMDIQVTKDGVPILYHPRDLSELTDGKGFVNEKEIKYIKKLKFKEFFLKGADRNTSIPTLAEVLEQVKDFPLIVDLKFFPAEKFIIALINHIPEKEWSRLVFYSTRKEHGELMNKLKPDAITFEDRDKTRGRLLNLIADGKCSGEGNSKWVGFEMSRKMAVVEIFALGEGRSEVDFNLWSPKAMQCVHKMVPKAKIILFGVDNIDDYNDACKLNADGVYTNNPLGLLRN